MGAEDSVGDGGEKGGEEGKNDLDGEVRKCPAAVPRFQRHDSNGDGARPSLGTTVCVSHTPAYSLRHIRLLFQFYN